MFDSNAIRIGLIGLGYVGLPLAVEFGKQFPTRGFDIDPRRIQELRSGKDRTLEVSPEELAQAEHLSYTNAARELADCSVYVVTVPTPVDAHKRPDLGPLERASQIVGRVLKPGNLVIYESTVYPGATEEVCVPILARKSNLGFNAGEPLSPEGGFFVGYSPERINPGDKIHRLTTIRKVTAGSTPAAADLIDALYRRIIPAGTFKASSIRVAEAGKVIENTQRDVNIALINELALLFNRLGIDTQEVLETAGTKWNFLPFKPGLVGGHCIGVDPYYLTHKAQAVGYHPEVILAGRRLNDAMGAYVAEQVMKLMTRRRLHVVGARILILGLTFKENCPDIRNTRVVDIVQELQSYQAEVEVYDPWVDAEEARRTYGIEPVTELQPGRYDALVLAVAHEQFREMGAAAIRALGKPEAVLYDIKSVLPAQAVEGRL